MQIRCTYCQMMFAVNHEEMLSALEQMEEEKLKFYDAHCPKCRRANRVERLKMEFAYPNWREDLSKMAKEAPAGLPPTAAKPAAGTALSKQPTTETGRKKHLRKSGGKSAAKPAGKPASKPSSVPAKAKPAPKAAGKPAPKLVKKAAAKPAVKSSAKPAAKPSIKPASKSPAKPQVKTAKKPAPKAVPAATKKTASKPTTAKKKK